MKLHFSKDSDGHVLVHIGDRPFVTKDYIEMIHEVKNKQKIEAEFTEDISDDEKESVNAMLKEINQIGKTSTTAKKAKKSEEGLDYPKDDIDPDNIPF